jgi:hypothetical protein
MIRIETQGTFKPEKKWILEVLFRQFLGLDFELTFTDVPFPLKLLLPNGNSLEIADGFWSDIQEGQAYTTDWIPSTTSILNNPFQTGENLIVLYGNSDLQVEEDRIVCGADLPGAAFFMLSRWEEYQREENGRFPADLSLAVRAAFIQRPIVDEYARFLAQCLRHLGLEVRYPQQSPKLYLSCDVDHPQLWWEPDDRFRTLVGSLFKRRSLSEFLYWIRGPFWKEDDPYAIWDEWIEMADKKGLRWQFNFLGKRPKTSDCYYPINHPEVKDLIGDLRVAGQTIGFHASQAAATDPERFKKEMLSVKKQSKKLVGGRQHYLHFSVPHTWAFWKENGFDFESSMGYAEYPGFRCGTSQPYPVFDFVRRQPIGLIEQPLIAMDVTLALYQELNPDKGYLVLENLREHVIAHGGTFTLLWHNSSWNTHQWEPWKKVLQNFIKTWEYD